MNSFSFGPVKNPCGDCVDGYCTMNCSGAVQADFESRPTEFVGVATPTIIYVGVKSREEFDKIAAPLHDAGENERGHVLVKHVGEFDGKSVTVIFQHWLKSLTTAGHARLSERKKATAALSSIDKPSAEPADARA